MMPAEAERAGAGEPPPLAVALGYFGSALFFLLWGSIGLVWVAPALARGDFPQPGTVAVTHLFTLGWITLSILGALHHFVPVALRARLMPPFCAYLQLAVFDLGLVLFAVGEALGFRQIFLAGTALVALALLAFALRLSSALWRVRPRGRTARALQFAAAFLLIAVLYGVLLAGNQAFGWLGTRRPGILALHVHLALAGWVLLVLIAVAQRLLPMFLLTRAPDARLGGASLALVTVGAAALLAFHPQPPLLHVWLPLVLVALGVAVFLVQIAIVYAHTGLPELDVGMRLAGVGLVFLGLTFALAPFALRLGWADSHRVVLYISAAVLGTSALFICGHYYRLVPFLVWSRRFAERTGENQPPTPAALVNTESATLSLVCFVSGACIMLVAVARGLTGGAQVGALTFTCGTVLLTWQITRIMLTR